MEIIGLRINKIALEKSMFYVDDKDSYAYKELIEHNSSIINEYEFICYKDNQLISIKCQIENGMCYSGYCGADWLHSETSIIEEVGTLHYKPKGRLIVSRLSTDYIGNDYYTLYENDCAYYPSVELNINFDNWIETGRSMSDKPLWIFSGESASGKSFLAHSTNLKVLETDANPNFIIDETIDILVVGNKYNINLEDYCFNNRELIYVDFSK